MNLEIKKFNIISRKRVYVKNPRSKTWKLATEKTIKGGEVKTVNLVYLIENSSEGNLRSNYRLDIAYSLINLVKHLEKITNERCIFDENLTVFSSKRNLVLSRNSKYKGSIPPTYKT